MTIPAAFVKFRVETRASAKDGWVKRGLFETREGALRRAKEFEAGLYDRNYYDAKNVRVTRYVSPEWHKPLPPGCLI